MAASTAVTTMRVDSTAPVGVATDSWRTASHVKVSQHQILRIYDDVTPVYLKLPKVMRACISAHHCCL